MRAFFTPTSIVIRSGVFEVTSTSTRLAVRRMVTMFQSQHSNVWLSRWILDQSRWKAWNGESHDGYWIQSNPKWKVPQLILSPVGTKRHVPQSLFWTHLAVQAVSHHCFWNLPQQGRGSCGRFCVKSTFDSEICSWCVIGRVLHERGIRNMEHKTQCPVTKI